jgi:hypothetical protein
MWKRLNQLILPEEYCEFVSVSVVIHLHEVQLCSAIQVVYLARYQAQIPTEKSILKSKI